MTDMPEEIWAYHTYEGSLRCIDRPCSAGSTTEYIRADIHDAKVAELDDKAAAYDTLHSMFKGALQANVNLHKRLEAADGLAMALDTIRKSGFVSYSGEKPHVIASEALAAWQKAKGEK